MKRILFFLIILFSTFISCENSEIKKNIEDKAQKVKSIEVGRVENSITNLNNREYLISAFQKDILDNEISDIKIADLKIDYSKAGDNEKVEIIQLILNNADYTTLVSYLVHKKGESLVVKLNSQDTKVECKGCRKGCSPRRDENGDGWCTKCTVGNTCDKTETENSDF